MRRPGLRPRPAIQRPQAPRMPRGSAPTGITSARPAPGVSSSARPTIVRGGYGYWAPAIPYPAPFPVPSSNGRDHAADDGATLDPNVLVDMGDDNAAGATPDAGADATPDTGADFAPDASDGQEPSDDSGADAAADADADAGGDFTPDDGGASSDSEADADGGATSMNQKNRDGRKAGYERGYQRGFRAGYAARHKKCRCARQN